MICLYENNIILVIYKNCLIFMFDYGCVRYLDFLL